MRNLIIQGQRQDEYKGHIQVKIEPSSKIQPGIFISINDHYEIQEELSCKAIIDILNINWAKSRRESEILIKYFVEHAP